MTLWRVDRQNYCMDAAESSRFAACVQPLAPRHATDLSNFDDYDKMTDLCDGDPYDMSSPECDVDF